MGALRAIAESMILDQILSRGLPISQKSKASLILQVVAGLLVIVALGFLIAAFHTWLAVQYAPDVASLITAGAAFALAIIASLAAYGVVHQRRAKVAMFKHEMKNNIQAVLDTFDEELGDHVREKPALALAIAGVAGLILGNRVL